MEKLFFIRIGGTAMGGVAAACQRQGNAVSGSEADLYEPMKSYLAEHGVHVFPSFDPANLLAAQPDRVVVGNAVSRGNEELEVALEHRQGLISLPALVAEKLIDRNTSIVIAGTHGKTTTTSMTAWMLEQAGLEPGFLIGGVPGNFDESCRPVAPARHNTEGGYFVTEGDEYDSAYFDKRSKFLHYRPDIAVINNIEFDHADIFENLDAVKRTFRLFARLVPRNGVLLANGDDVNVAEVVAEPVCPVETFGLSAGCTWRADNVTLTSFDLVHEGQTLGQIPLVMPGEHNAVNMLVACVIGLRCGLTLTQVIAGAASFRPPKRRLELIGEFQGATVVDDFAHHPTAIQATITALGQSYPGRKIWVAFEPRSNTTTRNIFQEELSECFAGASGVCFGATDRPWRYSESERLNMDALVASLRAQGIHGMYVSIEQAQAGNWGELIYAQLQQWVQPGDVVAVLSNGNFDGLRARLLAPA